MLKLAGAAYVVALEGEESWRAVEARMGVAVAEEGLLPGPLAGVISWMVVRAAGRRRCAGGAGVVVELRERCRSGGWGGRDEGGGWGGCGGLCCSV